MTAAAAAPYSLVNLTNVPTARLTHTKRPKKKPAEYKTDVLAQLCKLCESSATYSTKSEIRLLIFFTVSINFQGIFVSLKVTNFHGFRIRRCQTERNLKAKEEFLSIFWKLVTIN